MDTPILDTLRKKIQFESNAQKRVINNFLSIPVAQQAFEPHMQSLHSNPLPDVDSKVENILKMLPDLPALDQSREKPFAVKPEGKSIGPFAWLQSITNPKTSAFDDSNWFDIENPFRNPFKETSDPPKTTPTDSPGGDNKPPPQTLFGLLSQEDAVRDSMTITICWIVRVIRIMTLWIIIHFADKYYQAEYLMSSSHGKPPPRLWTLPLFVLAIEASVFAVVMIAAFSMTVIYKRPFNTFVIDKPLLLQILRQYIFSTVPLAAAGMLVSHVVQSSKALRYCEDGARAVRSSALMFFYMAVIVVALPVDLW